MATLPDVQLSVDAIDLHAMGVSARFELGLPFRCSVQCRRLDEDAVPPEQLLGKSAVLKITPSQGPPFRLDGLVFEASTSALRHDSQTHVVHDLVIAPAISTLEVGRDSRYFQDKNVVDILHDVLDRASLADKVRYELTGTYPKKPYVAQQNESDWDFLQRILAESGISHRFDFEDDGTYVVFFDDSPHAPDCPGGAMEHVRETLLLGESEALLGVSIEYSACHESVVFRDYDPARPALRQEASSESGSQHPLYDYPGRYREPSEGKRLAAVRLDGLRAGRAQLTATTTNPRTWPGRLLEISPAPRDGWQHVLVTRLELDVVHEHPELQVGTARFSLVAIPASTVFRHAVDGTRHVAGPGTAMVVGPSGKELHTDDVGRIRAQFWWDREGGGNEKSSTWMRVGQFAVGNSMVRPRVGWDVLVEHLDGDSDVPQIMSHLYDGTHPPPYPLPANKTRTSFQTATTPGGGSANEIRFEDKSGSEEIFLNASKDMDVSIGDTKDKKVGNNHSHDIGATSKVTVGTHRINNVTADHKYKVGASETLTVSGSRTTGIAGGESVTIGGARSVTVIHGKSIEAGGGRSMTVGGNMMDIAALGVSRAVLGSATITVGSAWITAAAVGLGNVTLGAGAETVGGAKLQIGGGGVTYTVKGALAEAVGGAYVSAAGGNFGETATGAITFLVGGAFLVNSPTIEFEAESEISIVCGGSSIKISSSSIEVSAPAIAMPAGSIAKSASQVQHNP